MGIGVRQPVEVLCAHLWHICKFIHKYIYVCVHTHTHPSPPYTHLFYSLLLK